MKNKSTTYTIDNFEIHIEDVEETKRCLKQFAESEVASDVYDDNRGVLDNFVEVMQAGFGIYIGFQDEHVRWEE